MYETKRTNGNNESDAIPSATLGEALGELPVLAFIVVMANVAAAAMVARHTYDFVVGTGKE